MRPRIFQYNAPDATNDPTRWIAAPSQEQADAAARRRGWEKAGGEIFAGVNTVPTDRQSLKVFGCDVVIL